MAAKKLFVGNVAWATTSEGIRSLFEEHGPLLEANVIIDPGTGRSRGFAFVTFQNAEDAESAVSKLNGYNLDGRAIKVSYPKNPR